MVIHDASGSMIAAFSKRVPLSSSPTIVEALACRKALEFAKEVSALHCVIEGDAEVIIKAILSMDSSHPEYGHVLEDIFDLAEDFSFISFCHVKRVGNSVAHYLARRAKSGVEFQVWFNAIPDDIAPIVARDAV